MGFTQQTELETHELAALGLAITLREELVFARNLLLAVATVGEVLERLAGVL